MPRPPPTSLSSPPLRIPTSTITDSSPMHSPTTPRGRTSTSFHLPPHHHPRRRSSTMTTGTTFSSALDGEEGSEVVDAEEEEWEGGDEGEEYVARLGKMRGGKKGDEPMKPMTVIFYVVMFYLIWQLLTRSTEGELLSHVAPSSSLAQHLSEAELSALGIRNSPSLGGYQLPYHFPHIPSPIPPTGSFSTPGTPGAPGSAPNPGFFRLALGVLMYPLYLLVTLLAIPLPLVLNIGHVLFSVILAVLYPFTLTGGVAIRMFFLTPLAWAGSVFRVLSPVLAFVAGVLGFGVIMGLSVGWAGRRVLDALLGRRSAGGGKGKRSGKGKGKGGSRGSRSGRSRRTEGVGYGDDGPTGTSLSGSRPLRSIVEEHTGFEGGRGAETIANRRHSGRTTFRLDAHTTSQGGGREGRNEHRRRSPSTGESVPPNPSTPVIAKHRLYEFGNTAGQRYEAAHGNFDEGEDEEEDEARTTYLHSRGTGGQKRVERDEDGAVVGTRRRGVLARDHEDL